MIIRCLAFLCGLCIALPSWGGSTIDPTLPSAGQGYSSASIRDNFQAAINDINDLSAQIATRGGYVASNAALINMAGLQAGAMVYRAGFYAAGDGGAAYYIFSSSPCSLNGGNGDNGSQVKSGANCWLANFAASPTDVRVWGAKCDGVTDDHEALQAAFSAGTPLLSWPNKVCYSASSLTLSGGISVVGQDPSPGAASDNAAAPYTLLHGSAATISLGPNSGLRGMRITRFGISAPTTLRQAITEANNFAGVGLTVNSSDVIISHVTVNGFATAVQHRNADRVHYDHLLGDDTNGLDVDGCFDDCTWRSMEFWPFLSAPYFLDHQSQSTAITSFSSGAGGVIAVALASAPQYPFQTGDIVVIGNTGKNYQAPNGRYTATAVDSTHLTLNGSSYAIACPAGCVAANEIAYLTASRRLGVAYSFKNAGGFVSDSYEYGFDTSMIYGVNAEGMNCIGCWFDGDTTAGTFGDNVPVGLQNGGPAGGAPILTLHNAFLGGKIYDKASSIVQNSSGENSLLVSNVNPLAATGSIAGVVGSAAQVWVGGLQLNNSVIDLGDGNAGGTNYIAAVYDTANFLTMTDVSTPRGGGTFFYQSPADCDKAYQDGIASCSFVPILQFGGSSSGITYATQFGQYYRYLHSQQVTAVSHITLTSKGGASGAARLTGMPAHPGTLASGSCTSPFQASMASLAGALGAFILNGTGSRAGSGTAQFAIGGATGTTSLIDNNNFTNTSDVYLTCNYNPLF